MRAAPTRRRRRPTLLLLPLLLLLLAALLLPASSAGAAVVVGGGGGASFSAHKFSAAAPPRLWGLVPRGGGDETPTMVLRIRKPDGSVARLAVADADGTTLASLLEAAGCGANDGDGGDDDDSSAANAAKVKVGAKEVDATQTVSELGLKHGALVSVVLPPRPKQTAADRAAAKAAAAAAAAEDDRAADSGASDTSGRWDPFPDLAKSRHSVAARRTKAVSRARRGGMSYDAIANLRSSSMHEVEPQNEGPVSRIYMCSSSAERFRQGCQLVPTKKKMKAAAKAGRPRPEIETRNRCGLLLGTSGNERTDKKKDKVRTSLSTPLYERDMCCVVKVQAVWEPPQLSAASPKGVVGPYDASKLTKWEQQQEVKRALALAEKLGLKPVGWIYSYSDDRHDSPSTSGSSSSSGGDEDALPVYIPDVVAGASLQVLNMQSDLGREEGKQFVTLALDARTGSCEAFQLSDVAVQMVSEGVLTPTSSAPPPPAKRGTSSGTKKKKAAKSARFAKTTEPILIQNEETRELDSVLCLVNTALLAHSGSFAGTQPELGVKRPSGTLTVKSTKRLLEALDASDGGGVSGGGGNDSALLEALCDFNVLLGLEMSGLLNAREMDMLCGLVKKWSRGQRRGTVVGKELKLALRSALGG